MGFQARFCPTEAPDGVASCGGGGGRRHHSPQAAEGVRGVQGFSRELLTSVLGAATAMHGLYCHLCASGFPKSTSLTSQLPSEACVSLNSLN